MKKALFRGIKDHIPPEKIESNKMVASASIEDIYEKTLVVTIFIKDKQGSMKKIFKQFITKTDFVGLSYIESDKGTWSTASLQNFSNTARYRYNVSGWNDYLICASNKDHETIISFIGLERVHEDGINVIEEHQSGIRGRKLSMKHDIERRKLDKVHSQAVEITDEVYQWAKDMVTKDNAVVFFERDKKTKKKIGTCTYCKNDVEVVKNHNDIGSCPKCGTFVTFKGKNRAKYYEKYDAFAYLQRIDDGVMVRRFRAKIVFKRPDIQLDWKRPSIDFLEISRSFIENDAMYRNYDYEWGQFHKMEYRWIFELSDGHFYGNSAGSTFRNTKMRSYPDNLKEVFRGTRWEYSAFDLFKGKINPITYLRHKNIAQHEMMIKRGVHNLVQDVLNQDHYAYYITKKFENFTPKNLGLTEYGLFMTIKHNLGLFEVNALDEFERVYKIKLKIDQIRDLEQIRDGMDAFKRILEFSSFQKAINYINKQFENREVTSDKKKDIASTWKDYIDMCVKEKKDLTNSLILYPKELQIKHDELSDSIKARDNPEIRSGLKKTYELFEWLNFTDGKHLIKVASSPLDFVKESRVLGHCVARASYMDSMSKQKTVILLLRKAKDPSTPYFTVEYNIKTNKVVQYESKNRLRNAKEVDAFIAKWYKHIENYQIKGNVSEIKKKQGRLQYEQIAN